MSEIVIELGTWQYNAGIRALQYIGKKWYRDKYT